VTTTIGNITFRSIAVIFLAAILFSCINDAREVHDFLADKNLPITEARNISHVRTDSGRVDIRMKAPLMRDFSNRKEHPYSDFPEGIRITSIDREGDSVTIEGNYAISFTKTGVSEIREDVVIFNHSNKNRLVTSQIFWDKQTGMFFTERNFILYTPTDTVPGRGFESDEDLRQWWVKNLSNGIVEIKNNDL
jgi:LPS export ABC transporter protein LptC